MVIIIKGNVKSAIKKKKMLPLDHKLCILCITGPPAPLLDVSQGGHFFYGNKESDNI